MKKIKIAVVFAIFISLIITANGMAKEIKKQFSEKDEIKIDLILGSCTLENSGDSNIHVYISYTYDDEDYEVSIKEKKKKLILEEDFHHDDADGDSKWVIKVPKGMDIEFESATGDLNGSDLNEVDLEASSGTGDILIEDSNGEFELNSGTGDVEVNDCRGEFDMNSGTGDVSTLNSNGDFDVNSGTGNVLGEKIFIDQEAEFNSGTGEAEVIEPKGEDFDLSLNSGTDDAILKMSGLPIEGYYEFSAHSRRGNIVCPVDFDNEETYENGNGSYDRKSFTKGKDTPRYYISTGTGKAVLKR